MKEDYREALKKLTLIFLLNPFAFDRQDYEKQKGPETSEQSLFMLQNKFQKIPSVVTYYQTKSTNVI